MRQMQINWMAALAVAAAFGVAQAAQAAVITGVSLSGTGLSAAGANIVMGGFGEDVDAFTDRTHEWNGAVGQPTIADLGLVGADYIMFANNDRSVPDFQAAVTFAVKSDVYLFLDNRVNGGNPRPWMTSLGFVDTGFDIGVDENGNGVGPGVSIDNTSSIYLLTDVPAGSTVFMEQNQGGTNMYGLVAVGKPVPEPVSATLGLFGLAGLGVATRRRRA
jgi:PEP-CTERM motif